MERQNAKRFSPGTKIYYTGDMANCPSAGIITKYRVATKYTPEAVDIRFDDERFEGDTKNARMIPIVGFGTGAGCRFRIL